MNEGNKVKVLLEQHNQELSAIHEGILVMKDKIDATFDAVGMLQVDMNFVKDELKKIRDELTDKISKSEYQALEKRVSFLEKQLKI